MISDPDLVMGKNSEKEQLMETQFFIARRQFLPDGLNSRTKQSDTFRHKKK